MTPSVVLRAGRWVHRVGPSGTVEASAPVAPTAAAAASWLASSGAASVPDAVRSLVRVIPGSTPRVVDPILAGALGTEPVPADDRSLIDLRRARESIPWPPGDEEREFLLTLATAQIERALADPEEVLITLAREEERVERAFDREVAAADHWLDVGSPPLREYAETWRRFRERHGQHLADLTARVEASARQFVPNLSEVVGPRVAARLVAAAGGRGPLGRMTASRLQLLGSRRRPGPGRGPRFGLLYRASRMGDVPPARAGAFARSLAALAVIAARADGTGADLVGRLVARRDRRIEQLRRTRR